MLNSNDADSIVVIFIAKCSGDEIGSVREPACH